MPPPIRYPLPSLLALVIAALLAWKGAEWSRAWRVEVADRARRALEGPPVPNSDRPKVVAGPITRRALLLRDETPVSSRPKGPVVERIDRRMFVDIYDVWPEPGPATHVRIGNRKPVGWVPATDVLSWDTRLVLRAPGGRLTIADAPRGPGTPIEVGRIPLPVLASDGRSVEVAVWDETHPWSKVARRGWVRLDDLPPDAWGVWISQVELPTLLRLALEGDPPVTRLRAVLGRLLDSKILTKADVDAARPGLPPAAFAGESDPRGSAARLAEANSRTGGDATWSGLLFRFLPLGDLP